MIRFRSTLRPELLVPKVRDGASDGMTLAVEHLLTQANTSVPHDEGTLERSGEATVEDTADGVQGAVSYNTPYAVKQHEDMGLSHDGKGRAKWLELTMAQEREAMGQLVARAIREAMR